MWNVSSKSHKKALRICYDWDYFWIESCIHHPITTSVSDSLSRILERFLLQLQHWDIFSTIKFIFRTLLTIENISHELLERYQPCCQQGDWSLSYKSQKLIMFRLKSYTVKMENRKKLNLSKVAITFHTFPLAVLAHWWLLEVVLADYLKRGPWNEHMPNGLDRVSNFRTRNIYYPLLQNYFIITRKKKKNPTLNSRKGKTT